MKTTGMIRRVDSLGRIVIPKEIRKVLKIKENEQVEINVSENEIILNRYSEFDESDQNLIIFIETIKEFFKVDILLTDLNCFKVVTKNYKNLIGKEISPYLNHILEKREEVKEFNKTNLILSNLEDLVDSFYIIKPIIKAGDIIGLLILLSNDPFNENRLSIINLLNIYLDKYLE